jgi:hypothetical protein
LLLKTPFHKSGRRAEHSQNPKYPLQQEMRTGGEKESVDNLAVGDPMRVTRAETQTYAIPLKIFVVIVWISLAMFCCCRRNVFEISLVSVWFHLTPLVFQKVSEKLEAYSEVY